MHGEGGREGHSVIGPLGCWPLQCMRRIRTVYRCGRRFSERECPFHQRLTCNLGTQLPAWDPGKVKLPGVSARKSDYKTRAENLTNKILEFYPNSCSSPSRSPDSLGLDGCCNTKLEVSPSWCQELAPRDKERTVALLMGAENKTPSPQPTSLLYCEIVTVPLRRD